MITQFPIVLFGTDYYRDLWEYLEYMAQQGTINKDDLALVLMTDNVDEAMTHITTFIKQNYKIKPRRKKWWFFEKK
jgi:predicted Rossmann-fold nucleotide-binding protein